MLSSIVINHLQEQYETQTTPVICLYLDHKESIMHTPENLLGSLLKQFIQLKDSDPVSPDLRRSYQRARRRGAKPGLRNIRRLLHAELLIYDRVYLIVDAMDECSSKSRDLLKTELGKLQKLQPGKLSLMITSREFEAEACDIKCDHCGAANIKIYFHCYDCDDGEFDLCQSCKDMEVYCRDKTHKLFEPYNSVEVRIRIPNADLERYVREEIGKEMGDESSDFRDKRRHPNRLDTSRFQRICQKAPELLERIPSVVVERADGKFLFAKLFMDSIKAKQTVKQIRATLNSFPDELDTIYQEAMQRIEDENTENDRATALKVFSLIVCAHRPLCLAELQHVLAVEPGDVDFDQESVCDKELILSITGGLVTIDNDENAVVRLVHSTLHAYLSDTRDRWFPKAEVEMANACLIYMSFDAFSRPCYKIEDFDSKRKDYPFIAYASQYWGDHVRDTGPDQRIEATALRFLDDPLRIAAYIQAAWCTDAHGPVSWDVRKGVDPLHICAWFGLSSVVSALDQGDLDVDVQDSTYGQTPLMYACRQGHVEVVRQLLDLNASVNIVSARGRTAMFEAVEQNQEEIVRLLLRKEELDINAVQPKESNRTALMLAAYMGHLKIVLDLLEHPDININQQDAKGYTTLSLATIKDFELIVRLLLTKPEIDVNLADYTAGRSALILAAERDECAIVELLLQHHADPSRKDHQGGGTAMLRAIDFGRISVLESMLPYKVDLRSLDDDGRGLVHGASTNGYPDIIRWLKQQDLDLNLQDKNGFTPLHDASRNGKREVVGTLLELGADGTIKDNFGRTPLIVAWQYGQTQILDILKDKSTNEQGSSTPMLDAESLPIWSLVKQGHSDLITKAIAAGKCDLLEREPGSDDTALHCAVQADKLQILQLLLQDAKMSPDCVNRYRRTPLHIAAIDSKLDAATVLTENHASLDLEDQWGHTPLSIAQSDENQYEMHFPVAIALIEAGADTKLVNIQKMFFAAVELGRVKAVQILLDRGADVLGTNPDGKKARELAKEAGDGDLMQVLKTSKSFHYKVDERKLEESLDMVDSFPSVPLEEPHGFVPFRPLRSDPIAI